MRFLIYVVGLISIFEANAFVGFNFALKQQTSPLPTLTGVKILTETYNITHAKIFDHDEEYIAALHTYGIMDVMVAIPNGELSQLSAVDGTLATSVTQKLAPYVAKGMRFTIAVGNEPLAGWYNGAYDAVIVLALTKMIDAIKTAGLATSVKVTVPFYYGIVSVSYPPSAGAFVQQHEATIRSITKLLVDFGSSFCINIYPFFAYPDSSTTLS